MQNFCEAFNTNNKQLGNQIKTHALLWRKNKIPYSKFNKIC